MDTKRIEEIIKDNLQTDCMWTLLNMDDYETEPDFEKASEYLAQAIATHLHQEVIRGKQEFSEKLKIKEGKLVPYPLVKKMQEDNELVDLINDYIDQESADLERQIMNEKHF